MKIVLLEPHPLQRVGLQHLIARMNVPAQVIGLEPGNLESLRFLRCEADLLILSIPADWQAARALTQLARERLQPANILLLCPPDADWCTSGVEVDEVFCCVPHDAPAEFLESAIRMGLPELNMTPESGAPSMGEAGRVQLLPGEGMPAATAPRDRAAAAVIERHTCGLSASTHLRVPEPASAGGRTPAEEAALLDLTPRQYDVLACLARGNSLKTTARELGISPATAKAHASQVYQRLNVSSKGEAVYAARNKGARFPG